MFKKSPCEVKCFSFSMLDGALAARPKHYRCLKKIYKALNKIKLPNILGEKHT